MANVRDAAVICSGMVVDIAKVFDRENTALLLSYKVTVMAGGGFSIVKVTVEDVEKILAQRVPVLFVKVAWFIRNAQYSVEGNSGMSTRIVSVVTEDDIDELHSLVSGLVSAA